MGYQGRCRAVVTTGLVSLLRHREDTTGSTMYAHLATETDDRDPLVLGNKDTFGSFTRRELRHPLPRRPLLGILSVRVHPTSYHPSMHPLDGLLVQLERKVESLGHGRVGDIVLLT